MRGGATSDAAVRLLRACGARVVVRDWLDTTVHNEQDVTTIVHAPRSDDSR